MMEYLAGLDGKAIFYPEEVDELVAADGNFRTGLTAEQMATTLRIDPSTIRQKKSANEIDPSAVLFKVAVGTLCESSKSLLRTERTTPIAKRRPPYLLVGEFVRQDVAFTLESIRKPDADRELILTAISRAARELMPQPGDKAKAILTSRAAIESGNIYFGLGQLPPEAVANATALSANQ